MRKDICPRCKTSDGFVSSKVGEYTCKHCAQTIHGKSLKIAIENACPKKETITIDAKFRKGIELRMKETIPEDEMVKKQVIKLRPRKKSSFKYEVK